MSRLGEFLLVVVAMAVCVALGGGGFLLGIWLGGIVSKLLGWD